VFSVRRHRTGVIKSLLSVAAATATAGLLFVDGSIGPAPKAPHTQAGVVPQLPLVFQQNVGQAGAPSKIRFVAQLPGGQVFLGSHGAMLAAMDGKGHADVVGLRLVGAAADTPLLGTQPQSGRVNYLIGSDPSKWRRNIKAYGAVRADGVYPGIDLVWHSSATAPSQLEYDFLVAPGADPSKIELGLEGASAVHLDKSGGISLELGKSTFTQAAPLVYQTIDGKRRKVSGHFALGAHDTLGFTIGRYDHTQPLTIDPLVYSTFLGGSSTDQAFAVASDSAGDTFVTGSTSSLDFPTVSPYQGSLAGGSTTKNDEFITEINPAGTAVVYSTYLGGTGANSCTSCAEGGKGIAVDASGSAYVVGSTVSTDFPVTAGAYQTTNSSGIQMGVVTKLSPSGNALAYSTYLPGGTPAGVAVDSSGQASVAGTASSTLPTAAAFQPTFGGCPSIAGSCTDAFVTKFNAAGSALVYSTFLGGANLDVGSGVAVDALGNTYVTGETASSNFPTASPYQAALAGGANPTSGPPSHYDAFLTKVSPTGALTYSTYLGGTASDFGNAVAVDSSGSAYVTGNTLSSDFPTVGAVQPSATGSAFLTKFNPSGSALVYSTYLGGGGANDSAETGLAISVDGSGDAAIGGKTNSTAFPTQSPTQSCTTSSGFVTEYNPAGSAYVISTCFGGSGTNAVNGLAFDGSGRIHFAGLTTSTQANFPAVAPIYPTKPGATDAFVAEISSPTATPTLTSSASPSVVAGGSIFDSATISGTSPTGTMTFNVYGPGDTSCATPLATSTATVSGNGTYQSAPFTANAAGTYQWTASYGGDSANSPATAAAPCANPSEAVIVTPATPTSTITSATTAMNIAQNFTTFKATTSCPNGSTLVSGGDELTKAGALVGNNGAVTMGNDPSDSSGNLSSDGTTTPGSWTTVSGYSGQADGGADSVTTYAVCATPSPTSTIIKVAVTATNTLGPVTAVCPTGDPVVGGGGGYTAFVGSNNTKLYDSYPSDAAGDPPTAGQTNPVAWTVSGQSNNATSQATTAVALCATGGGLSTTIDATTTNNDHTSGSGAVAGGSDLTATASCGTGTTLLAGGSRIFASQNGNTGPGSGAQGVHMIQYSPSDSSGNAVGTGSASSWTVTAQNGGQNIDSLDVTAYTLCAGASSGPSNDLSISGSGSPNPVATGAPLTYTLTATNGGSSTASDVTVSDPLPANTTFVSATASAGSCSQSGGVVTCHLGFLAAAASDTVTLTVTPTQTGNLSDTATIAAAESDPNSSNNSTTVSTTVGTPSADLAVTNSASPSPGTAGSTETYTIVVTNNGPNSSTGGTVTDVLPASVTFVSATGTTGNCTNPDPSGTVTCFLGTLASGASSTITLKVTPNNSGPLSDTATAAGTESDPVPGNNSATAPVTIQNASPTLATQASTATTAGSTITDTATLAGGSGPTGAITFNLYAPGDTSCSSSVFTTTKAVTGNGSYTSAGFVANSVGTYRWIASYGGDANDNATGPGSCSDPNESTSVGKASPTLATQVSAEAADLGSAIHDSVTIAGGGGPPGGSISVSLYGPDDATCSSIPQLVASIPVSGNGTYTTPSFTPSSVGTYRWVASYSGDAVNNAPPASSCTDPNEYTLVRAPGAGLLGLVDATTAGTSGVAFTASQVTGSCPGGTVMTGGGIREFHGAYPGDGNETAGIHINGTLASDTSGNSVADGTNDVSSWTAISAYGGQAESGDSQTVYSMCTADGPIGAPTGPKTVVKVVSAAGQAVAHQAVTATCPSGTTLIGGGAMSQPATSGNLKPIGSFPSDALGNVSADGATNPNSWTAVGGIMGSLTGTTTTVYAVCSLQTALNTVVHAAQVHYVPQSSIQGPGAEYPATASCQPTQVLLDGGYQFLVSGGYPASGNGYYGWHWTADYPGAADGTPALDGGTNPTSWTAIAHAGGVLIPQIDVYAYALCETLAVPTLATQASAGITIGGGSVSDTATVSGGFSPGGTVTFKLYGPNDGTCALTPAFNSGPVALSGGTAGSGTFTPTVAGTYRWIASYSGDQNNAAVNGTCTDTNESVVVAKAAPTVSTQLSQSGTVTDGTPVSDQATLNNASPSPGGTISYGVFSDSACTQLVANLTPTNATVSGTTVPASPFWTAPGAGTFYFQATYSGDANNAGPVSSPCASEQLTVVGAPALSTVAQSTATIGGSIADTATITGGDGPTGTITFSVYGPADPTCASAPVQTLTVPVSGDGSYGSGPFTPANVGTYNWAASYSGDANNLPVSTSCLANPSVSITSASQLMTNQSFSITPVTSPPCAAGSVLTSGGNLEFDAATAKQETNGLHITGSLPGSLDGSGNPLVSNGSTDPSTWTAIGGFGGVSDPNDDVVAYGMCASGAGMKASSGPSTIVVTNSVSPTTAVPEASVTATCPSGTVLVGGGGLTVPGTSGNLKPIGSFPSNAAGVASLDGQQPTSWTAVGGIMGSLSGTTTTAYAICSYNTAIVTTARVTTSLYVPTTGPNNVVIGGGELPPVTATCSPASTLMAGGEQYLESGIYPPTGSGYYGFHWLSEYPSDTSGAPTTNSTNSWSAILHQGGITIPEADEYVYALCAQNLEESTVSAAPTSVTTQVSSGTVTVGSGQTISDTATLSGGNNPTGTMTFVLYPSGDANCAQSTSPTVFTTPVSGNGQYSSTPYLPPHAGTYLWVADYSGDANNIASGTACNSESATVAKASPTMSSHASAGGVIGTSITDTATLAGGANLNGARVTFTLWGPNNTTCTGTPAFTTQVTDSASNPNLDAQGNGPLTSASFTPTQPGTYVWVDSFSGSTGDNNPIPNTSCSDSNETVVITKATPAISTQAQATATIGVSISDTATLAGGLTPTGQITFTLYGPNDPTCSNSPVTTLTATAAGDGSYGSGPYTPSSLGTYEWAASYAGDANNAMVTSSCQAVPSVSVASNTKVMTGTGFTITSVTAPCASGNVLVGGGVRQFDATTAGAETPGLHVTGTNPSDSSGNPVTNGSTDPSNWTATGGYGGGADPNDDITSFAMCASGAGIQAGSPPSTVVVTNSVTPTTAIPDAPVTATCPSGTVLVGGGALTTPGTLGNLKPGGSFPSDAAGNPALDGSTPNSWTAVGIIMGSLATTATTAYAVCSYDTSLVTVVHVNPRLNLPQTTEMPSIVSCTPGSVLLSGGALFLQSGAFPASGGGYYGFHFIGDYPSDSAGNPASSTASSWTSVVHPGGISEPNMDVYSYALCGQPLESSTVSVATPTVASQASGGFVIGTGGSITDTATISGGVNPTGSVTFKVYGPNDTSCAANPAATLSATASVSGNGSYTSAPFTPTAAGTYRWVVAYSGDGNNNASGSPCNASNESVAIALASPTLSSQVSASTITVGNSMSDSVTISGGYNPTGLITFQIWGPNNPTCTGTAFNQQGINPNGNGTYNSISFTPTQPGTYIWTTKYGGDGNNNAVPITSCTDPNETVQIVKASPTISTQASAGVIVGGSISDTATLHTAVGPPAASTVTFNLYAASDSNCSNPVNATPIATATTGGTSTTPTYTSAGFTPPNAGSYKWVASFAGDTKNNGVTGGCGDGGESITVAPAGPTLSTQASASGGSVSDVATLHGASGTPGAGLVTFNVYTASDTTCANPLNASPLATVSTGADGSGNPTYTSASFTPASVGTYVFVASFGGNTNNVATAGGCADAGESATVAAFSPTLTTAASAGGAVGGSFTDTATLHGAFGTPAASTVTFRVYAASDGTCSSPIGAALATASTGMSSGNPTYTSSGFTASAPGTYKWVASFAGDSNDTANSSGCSDPSETFTVTKAAPTISTQASTGTTAGQTSDVATLHGAFGSPDASTVTFDVYAASDTNCSSRLDATPLAAISSGVDGSGNPTYTSAPFTAASAGGYVWVARFAGDARNMSIASGCGDPGETVTIGAATPAISTQASANVTLGGPVSDTATLTGALGTPAAGTVTFQLYHASDSTCSSPVNTAPIATVSTGTDGSGNPTYTSATFTPSATGTYKWVATFAGNASNNVTAGGCSDPNESAMVSPKPVPVIATNASAGVTVGGSISDTASLHGAVGGTPAASTVTFNVYAASDTSCANPLNAAPIATTSTGVNGASDPTYTSAAYPTTAAGTYVWVASFAGNAGNGAVSSGCADPNESVSVAQAAATISTQASSGATAGGTISDTATLNGAYGSPSADTVTFDVFAGSDTSCSNPLNATPLATVSGTYTSAAFGPVTAGTYTWVAHFAGDANNQSFDEGCGDAHESVTVGRATTTVSTKASTGVTIGGSITDTATIHGAFGTPAMGTVTFNVYAASDTSCSSPLNATPLGVVTTGTDGSANPTYTSAPFTPSAVGSYTWVATFAGDTNNKNAAGGCGDAAEAVSVSKAAPTLSTNASSGVPVGQSITDVATLHGAYGVPDASAVTFDVYAASDTSCSHPVNSTAIAATGVSLVGGDPTYTSGPFWPGAAGTYVWAAHFAGDASNRAAPGTCSDSNESVTLSKLAPTISTQATVSGTAGSPITDVATLHGAYGTPTAGTVTFRVYAASDTSCSNPLDASPIATSTTGTDGSGNPTYTSAGFTPSAAGTYTWIASFGGDTNNTAESGLCGDPNESTTVTAPPNTTDLSITKSAPTQIGTGSSLTYTIGVTNGGPAQATGVTVSDPLPTGLSFTSAGSTQGSCSQHNGTVTCNIGTLANGSSAQITIVAKVTATSGSLSNTASVSGNQTDPNSGNNRATASTAVVPSADLSITKTGTPGTLVQGGTINYSLVVKNAGPSAAAGVVVTDPLPSGEVLSSADPAGCTGTTTLTCTIGTLASGKSATITFKVTTTASGKQTNTATVSSPTSDPNTANNSSTATTTVNPPSADLSITKKVAGKVKAGKLSYMITVANAGPSTATGVTVTDVLPSGETFSSASAGCTGTSTVTCTIATLPSGANATFTITVTAPSGTYTNTATVSATSPIDPKLANNSASVTTVVNAIRAGPRRPGRK
jgi:uncharacterized repeat protein (TIGR01451 family)